MARTATVDDDSQGCVQSVHSSGRRLPDSRLLSCGMRLSGADEASPLEGLTGPMGRLGHVPLWPRRGL